MCTWNPSYWEAEAGESLEPGRWRLQWAEILPLHSGLDNRVRLCLQKKRPGGVALTYNPSTLGGWGRWIMKSRDQHHTGQHCEIPSLLNIQKISWGWWCTPVVPATWEAEAGELLEPKRWRLQWAEIVPLHSSLGNKSETPSQKKKNK